MSKKNANSEMYKKSKTSSDGDPSPTSDSRRIFMTASTEPMEQMEKAAKGIMEACEEMNSLAFQNMDAAIKSATAMSNGLDEITRNAGGLVQESLTRGMNAGKMMMGAKTVREAMDMQSEFMKECFDCWVSGTGKISKIRARMTQQVFEPMTEQAHNTMNKLAQKSKAA